ncbi:MAG: hypothetical protein DRQ47_09825 [Gammaproteobacteria bacterium]|nr:MAG: hypothetical protein DRQ47_09825 [Gammaproteobacteria bacterium]
MDIDTITEDDMRFNPPRFSENEIAAKVKAIYGLSGLWSTLVGERDQNFRLITDGGQKYVVKIAGPDEDLDVSDFQVQALIHLEKVSPNIPVPRIIRTNAGNCLSSISDSKGVSHALRIVTYLEGIPYGEGNFPDNAHLQKIGAFQGEMVNAMAGFSHHASSHFMPWNLSNGVAVSKDLWAVAAEDVKSLAAPLLPRLRDHVLPILNASPSQVIHNDAHPYNLLRQDIESQDVTGLIDFGDMVYAPIINDLAVMATTFQRKNINDIEIVTNLLIGFHRAHPLTDEQVSLLLDAMILRLLITILLTDIKINMEAMQDPDILTDRVEAFDMLQRICRIDHDGMVNNLRAACGYN